MRAPIALVPCFACLAACDGVFGLVRLSEPMPDAPPPRIVTFGEPMLLPGAVLTSSEEDDPSLTEDLCELYLLRNGDLYISRRATATDSWPAAVPIMELNTTASELRPSVAADGLTLYFSRSDGAQRDIYVTTRATRADLWTTPVLLALDLNRLETNEHPGWSSADGLVLLVESFPVVDVANGSHDLFIASRSAIGEPFTSVPLDGINTVADEGGGWATADGSTIFFESNRGGSTDVWEAVKSGDSWYVQNHPELDSTTQYRTDGTPWISSDGKLVVFSSSRTGNDELYMATR